MNSRQCSILALTLAFCGTVAVQAATSGNPYQTIVARNVFGLVPIPTGPPPNATPDAALPKIIPNGIMTIFGKLQVLFKVSEPGKPANQEASYMMSEGDRQDDIEVQKIDEPSATITFNNHGTIQELPLVAAKATTGAPPPVRAGMTGGIPLPRPSVVSMAKSAAPTGIVGYGGRISPNGNNIGSSPSGLDAQSLGSSASANRADREEPLTPEAQVILMEANRMVTQDAVNQGEMPPLPPTEMTPPDATGIGGRPLVTPP